MDTQSNMNNIKSSDLELKNPQPLGEGGFSSVYHMSWRKRLSWRRKEKVDVAAKKVTKREVGLHELQMLSGLDHPNVVKLIGVVDEGIEFLLILELCEGGSLRSFLDKGQRITLKQFYNWLMQTALPLEFLKQKNIIHKDVKSPNYLITSDNTVKLGDFGLAKKFERTISNATEGGSHPWMAPELLKDGKLSPKYDIFAFGVVAWELWTGKFPHKGLEWQVIMMKVCHRDERLPIPEDCPEPIKKLIDRCWKTDWKDRPNIEEVVSTIADAVAQTTHDSLRGPAWEMETEFDIQDGSGKLSIATSVAVNPSNNDVIIAADTQVLVYSERGEFKCKMNNAPAIPWWQVAVNSDNEYLVTDGSVYLKIYHANAKSKAKMLSPSPHPVAFQPGSLRGLTMDSKRQVLLIGDVTHRYINKHKQNGTYIHNSIKVDVEPWFIAVASLETIVVADWNHSPQILDQTGQVLQVLVHSPCSRGLCCQQGALLVNCRRNILCFTESGKYLGNIPIQQDGNLTGIAMTADFKKLITISGSVVKVFRNPLDWDFSGEDRYSSLSTLKLGSLASYV